MRMEQPYINDLIERYKQGLATSAELDQLNQWYRQIADKDAVYPDTEELVHDRIFLRLEQDIQIAKPARVKLWPQMVAAAVALLLVGAGIYFYNANKTISGYNDLVKMNNIVPGKNTATLTLADGKTIALSEAKNGVVIDANSLTYNDGTVVAQRETVSPGNAASNVMHTVMVATPRGGTYQVVLPDGSKVWLNADSRLKFPSRFAGAVNRKVELNGEAYFEVAKDKQRPFVVSTRGQEINVLGTHFNINAYLDEGNTKTTLLEGLVNVSVLNEVRNTNHPASIVKLLPGQQAVLTHDQIRVKAVNPELAIDWKNGDFIFKDEALESILRKVSRWYNVEVIYQKDYPQNIKLGGLISRSRDLSAVLRLIESTGKVQFKIEGKRIIVTN